MTTNDTVVAGCGIAGLDVALRLERRRDEEVTVIDPHPHTIFYPALHRVLEETSFNDVRIDLEKKFAGRSITHVQDSVTGLTPKKNEIQLENGDTLSYEQLLVSVGSTTSYETLAGNEHLHSLRFKEDVERVQEKLASGAVHNAVIVGGGATGIETAASLHSAADRSRECSITIVERGDKLLSRFHPRIGDIVEHDYNRKDIDLRTNTSVNEIRADRVVLEDGEELESDLTIWAGGVKPNPLIHELGLPTTKQGLTVNSTLQVDGFDNVFAAGDCIQYDGKVNRAYYAIQEAQVAAFNMLRQRKGKRLKTFSPGTDLNLVWLGKHDAVFEWNGFCWRGLIPSFMRSWGVEKRYMLTRTYLL